jgi:hypothetical protein
LYSRLVYQVSLVARLREHVVRPALLEGLLPGIARSVALADLVR